MLVYSRGCRMGKNSNGGVQTANGIEFQKYCAIYLLFQNIESLKNKKYFICIEHQEDFLFCYQNENEEIDFIESYQAKKSSDTWSGSADFVEIVRKISEVGLDLLKDDHPKTENYTHKLNFITNAPIKLNNGKKQKEEKKSVLVNENNECVKLIEIENEIVEKIKKDLTKSLSEEYSYGEIIKELDKVYLLFRDFPKKSLEQKDNLVGFSDRIFGNKINDHRASVDVLLNLFRSVENIINQGNRARLLDKSKRVTSCEISDALNIITTKKMAYNLWRNCGADICEKLKISLLDKKNFEMKFENSFDYFKLEENREHQKILRFVKENISVEAALSYSEQECVVRLYKSYIEKMTYQLSELDVKAAIYSAYIEMRSYNES